MAASMVMLGAYAAVTGLVGLRSLIAAAGRASLPAYRAQHVELNDRGPQGRLRLGAARDRRRPGP